MDNITQEDHGQQPISLLVVDDHDRVSRELATRLARSSPTARIQSDRQHLDVLATRAARGLSNRLQLQNAQLAGLERRLGALNPQSILKRGFAILTQPDGSLVSRIAQAHPGDNFNVQLQDGRFSAQVLEDPPEDDPSP